MRVTDALNKVKEAQLRLTYDKDQGYQNLRGLNAIERPDGKPLKLEYGDLLKKHMRVLDQLRVFEHQKILELIYRMSNLNCMS